MAAHEISAVPGTPRCGLGESPLWHPDQGALWWVDIPGRALHRWQAASGTHTMWPLPTEPGCLAPLPGGRFLLAMRDGLFRFHPETGEREPLAAPPPYDPARERYNDGKADPQGRFWMGTIYEPRDAANASLYRWQRGVLDRMAGDITVSNGLAWAPDGRRMYWSDTKAHRIYTLPFDGANGALGERQVFAQFEPRAADQPLESYGGRPDGAAVDSEGAYWVAMFEGARLLRLSPDGAVLQEVLLPARCPTMPCFGGPDLRTLFITTASHGRSAEELAALPLSGQVLQLRVPVPGLPVHFAAA